MRFASAMDCTEAIRSHTHGALFRFGSAMRSGSNVHIRPFGWSSLRIGAVTSRMSPLFEVARHGPGAESTAGIA